MGILNQQPVTINQPLLKLISMPKNLMSEQFLAYLAHNHLMLLMSVAIINTIAMAMLISTGI